MEQRNIEKEHRAREKVQEQVTKFKRSREHRKLKKEQGKWLKGSKGWNLKGAGSKG